MSSSGERGRFAISCLLGMLGGTGCTFTPRDLPSSGGSGGIRVEVVLNDPEQYAALLVEFDGEWLRYTDAVDVPGETVASARLSDPPSEQNSFPDPYRVIRFPDVTGLRPGLWRFTVRATADGSRPIVVTTCFQEIYATTSATVNVVRLEVTQSLQSDRCTAEVGTVTGSEVTPDHDVAISSLTSPGAATNAMTARLNAIVSNESPYDEAGLSFTLRHRDPSGTETIVHTQTIGSLTGGASVAVPYDWPATGAAVGMHTFTAIVDPVLGETDAADNSRSVTVDVVVYDVALTNLTAPSPVAQGTSPTIAVEVTNQGNVLVSSATVRLDGVGPGGAFAIGTPQSVSNLGSGAVRTVNFAWNTSARPAGSYTLTARADPGALETNVANNSRSVTVTLFVTDVAVTSVAVSGATAVQGSQVPVTVTATNEGSTTESFAVRLADIPTGGATSTIGSQSITGLPGGTSTTLTFTWDTTAAPLGAHALTADITPVANEVDIADNSAAASVCVVSTTTPPAPTAVTPGGMTAGTSVSVTVSGNNFVSGARLSFAAGSGPRPVASVITVVDCRTITATVTAAAGGPQGTRIWDVVVAHPNGQQGVLAAGFTVTR